MSLGYHSPLPDLPVGYETPAQERARSADKECLARAEAAATYLPTAILNRTGESLWGDCYPAYPRLWKLDGTYKTFEDGEHTPTGATWTTERD